VVLLCLNILNTSDQFRWEVGWFDSIFADQTILQWLEKPRQSYRYVFVLEA